ncbi:MAG: excinuclease ABC subunit UvrA [Arenicellales bacterium]|jgi:excinuclease ABC subunit A|nr:excinuclease ABC subunit UvrA [Arenicellales bacterium]MDP6314322.1 excinuclease ABC subunit UvrA [Arenicellales bacterium]MDP7119084.1 excinuclease ABC subunit UvrA [Arenicellales bacterium]MEE1558024.1 excinuclease ABC subunit UvrA [Arenicellales bacterium]MEE1566272.1 excinuclease ABC subunit UvrA [Arenicellales bacterium]|tara:strand:- start:555 stop:3404 length:2850 start_codon:yes stop_codon:yes gene_type:complete
MRTIKIRGARTHNLQNVDLDLPRDRLIVITGLSGSGKSSLAFDTVYAEGQRRYVESLSAYARQFLSLMEKPDVDLIEGLSPAISIEQKSASHNPRSTVGTVTEVYDYLRLLFARVGEPRCPEHGVTLAASTVSEMVDRVMVLPEDSRILLLAPVVQDRKGEYQQLLHNLLAQGFIRARIDGVVCELEVPPELDRKRKHSIDVVVDRLVIRGGCEQRLAESFETALAIAEDLAVVEVLSADTAGKSRDLLFSARYACPHCGYSLTELEPRLFSFNNPAGACPDCDGLGARQFFDPERVVHDHSLSLAAGAIAGWDRRNAFYFQLLRCLANHYDFDIELPFRRLPKKVRQVILYGSGKDEIPFTYLRAHGRRPRRRAHTFEGVLPNMERRYRDSESNVIREELARYLNTQPCETCGGSRLRTEARHVFIKEQPVHRITAMPIEESLDFFEQLQLPGRQGEIATRIVREIGERLRFLVNVGLEYLALDRTAETLSGGEAQRIRLASQIGSGLVGVMYILDEPSIGLHQRDNRRLLDTLFHLRDLGNTIVMVEHDEEAIRSADHVVDLGPGAGIHGGRVVAQGLPETIAASTESVTGRYLKGELQIELPATRTAPASDQLLAIRGAHGNNLQNLDVEIPVGLFTCVTGVSGSGKSTLINHTLYPALARHLHSGRHRPAPHQAIEGLEHFDKVIDIDQSPIGRTPRSNPATYTGLFTPIRELFAAVPESRTRGYKVGRFSFNVRGGRCEACQGDGLIKVEMHFLPDIYVPCDACKGARYNRETLDIRYKGRTIAEVLAMTVTEAAGFFSAVPVIKRKLDTLLDVGLGYIGLGQSATTLSGGEAQRIKLARELSKRDTGRTLYILDEPTTGLHFHDIRQLLQVLHRLRDHGNTVVVIEHNLDVIKTADWIIDLGPEGGHRGGQQVAAGPPEAIARSTRSYTGQFLKPLLARQAPD